MTRRLSCAMLVTLCMALAPGQAQAITHPFAGVFATGIPAPFPSPGQPFDGACGVAVSPSGLTYVSDYNNHRIVAFGAGGEYLTNYSSPDADNSPCDLAVDSSGQLYGNGLHQGVVRIPGFISVDPERATGIAVSPVDDSLYVAHRDHVSVYGAGGSPLEATIGGPGTLGDAYGVAVSGSGPTAGYVYVADAADQTVKVFDPAGDPQEAIATIDGAGTPAGGFSDLTDTDLAVVPTSGNLLVADNLQRGFEHPFAAIEEFAPNGAYLGQISHWTTTVNEKTTSFALVHGQPTGLAVDAAGAIYVTSGNEEGSILYRFGGGSIETAQVEVAAAGAGGGRISSQLSGVPSGNFTGIDCGTLCTTEFERGLAVTFKAEPKPHSVFAGWTVAGNPGACTGTTPNCRLALFSATDITAKFAEIPQRTLTVSREGAGFGSVSSSLAGIECGESCSAGYDQGAKVTLTAEASPGSEFVGWSGACSGSGECRLTLGADAAVGARFEPIPRPAPIARGGAAEVPAISDPGLTEGPGVRLGALRLKGARATLEVTVPGPGALSASGSGLSPAKVGAKRAGVVTLSLALSKAGRRALGRKGRLPVKVHLGFKPSGGAAPVLLAKTVVFKRGRGK